MITFSDEADAIALANGTDYGLETAGLAFGAYEAAVNIMVGRKIMSDNLSDPAFDNHPVAATPSPPAVVPR